MDVKSEGSVTPATRKAKKKRVLIVDDHPVFREGIATLIGTLSDLDVSGEADSVEQALELIAQKAPDLALIDLTLNGANGLELVKTLHGSNPRLRMLILTMHEESLYAERALRAGAHGYIMKKESNAKIVEAIRCVLGGDLYVSPVLGERLIKLFVDHKQGKDTRTSFEKLSNRELQVYTMIGRGFPTKAIAKELELSEKTIQTYREHIKRKLGLRNATDLVHSATHWFEAEHNGK